jgi:hypothetical protein
MRLIITKDGKKVEQAVGGESEFQMLLRERFGLAIEY